MFNIDRPSLFFAGDSKVFLVSIIWGFPGNFPSVILFPIRSLIKKISKIKTFSDYLPYIIFPCNSQHTYFFFGPIINGHLMTLVGDEFDEVKHLDKSFP